LFQGPQRRSEPLRSRREVGWQPVAPNGVLAIDADQELSRNPAQAVHLPPRPSSADSDEGRPQALVDKRELTPPEPYDEHIGIRIESLADLIDQLTRRMPPPRSGDGGSSDDGNKRRNRRVGYRQHPESSKVLLHASHRQSDLARVHALGIRTEQMNDWAPLRSSGRAKRSFYRRRCEPTPHAQPAWEEG
jgi:hypothetical protein